LAHLDRDGVEIYYEVHGDGPALLLTHGYMAAKIPGAEMVVLADAGHEANLDQPAAFNRAVLDFLDRLDRSATPIEEAAI
jgi:hypothetical protein